MFDWIHCSIVTYMNKTPFFLALTILALFVPISTYAEQGFVVRIIDGDTIIVKIGKKIEHIRIIGIDTPELHDPKTGVAQCYAFPAYLETKKILEKSLVLVERDPLTRNRDVYGRLLRTVSRGSLSIAHHLVQNGYARVYMRSPASQLNALLTLQNEAKKNKRGLWSSCVH